MAQPSGSKTQNCWKLTFLNHLGPLRSKTYGEVLHARPASSSVGNAPGLPARSQPVAADRSHDNQQELLLNLEPQLSSQ